MGGCRQTRRGGCGRGWPALHSINMRACIVPDFMRFLCFQLAHTPNRASVNIHARVFKSCEQPLPLIVKYLTSTCLGLHWLVIAVETFSLQQD
eukprot:1144453-Pelagomonas_calceolata.AAC.3